MSHPVPAPIVLGPFELRRPIGRGGLAEVWRAVHQVRGLPVAVKVMTQGRTRRYREVFDNEVRAMAALEHPGVVVIYDHGVVDGRAERASGGRLTEGSPWLAMELASEGTLADHLQAPMPWTDLKRLLVALLDALAHAHARGVVHRDIKPANVLVCSERDPRPGLKLADFGLAHPADGSAGTRRISGTPAFMAPEQFHGAWRDYGPWTDLYALGVLAQLMSSGQLPFPGQTLDELRSAHLGTRPRPLVPRAPVPEGFQPWLTRLLEKRPSRRFRRAADAAWELERLGDPLQAFEPPVSVHSQLPEQRSLHTLQDLLEAPHRTLPEPEPGEALGTGGPPLPSTWRRPPSPKAATLPLGLGLVGVRRPPFVGRGKERDRIWEALARVRSSGSAQIVWVSGPPGVGKRRLVRWMAERAHELGAVTVLRATHNAIQGPTDGLGGLLARMLRCQGLAPAKVLERSARSLKSLGLRDPEDHAAVAELITGADQVRSPAERHELIHRLLAARSRTRTLLVWLDEVQWGADALAWVRRLLSRQDQEPSEILVLLTGREHQDADPLAEQELLQLAQHEACQALRLGELSERHQRDLLRRMLTLEPGLAREVLQRSAGNPMFAVLLVEDWGARGLLVPTPHGYARRAGAGVALPDDIHALFRQRLTRALEGERTAGRALELAAVLGRDFAEDEWKAACWEAGVAIAPDSLRMLVEHGLLLRSEEGTETPGWRFAHGMLRESLEREAADGQRLAEHHRSCAAGLRGLPGERPQGLAGRIGRHALAGGDHEEAAEALLQAVKEHRRHSEYLPAMATLDLVDQALAGCADPSDPRWGESMWLRAILLRYTGQLEPASRLADELIARAEAEGWELSLARALDLRGNLHRMRRQLDPAWDAMTRAHAMFERLGDAAGMGTTLLGLGAIAWHRGDLPRAEDIFQQSVDHHRRAGRTAGIADSTNGLAELARARGEAELAERLYRQALALHEQVHSGIADVVRLNLCLVRLQRGERAEVLEDLERCRQAFQRQGRQTYEAAVDLMTLTPLAALGDWPAWDAALGRAMQGITGRGVLEKDIAWAARAAGVDARDRGERQRAWQALVLARSQYRGLSLEEEAAQVQEELRALGL